MAKVIFYRNPLDIKKVSIFEHHVGTIEDALIKLRIEKEALSVTINGECPDECDLKYVVKDGDLIEIRRVVHGSSSSSKSNLAMVVQLVALVAMFIPGVNVLYVALGSSIIAGALQYRAAKLAAKESGTLPEVEVEANTYSLTNVANEARPLEPMIIPMGSHRYAPDYHTDSFQSVYNNAAATGYSIPIETTFIPGINQDDGAEHPLKSTWILMPADYIAAGFPQYDIRIAPWHFEGIASEVALDAVKDYYLDSAQPQFYFRIQDPTDPFGVKYREAPLIIYHSSASDPFYGRYNMMFFLDRFRRYPMTLTWPTDMTSLFNGTSMGSSKDFLFTDYSNSPYTKYAAFMGRGGLDDKGYYYPSTITDADSASQTIPKLGAWLLALNNGVYNSSNKDKSFATQLLIRTTAVQSVISDGVDVSTQTFNFGIGDLDVSERRIGSMEYDINSPDTLNIGFSQIIKDDISNPSAWKVTDVPIIVNDILIRSFPVFPDVLRIDNKKLYNEDSTESTIPTNDLDKHNFIYLEGQPGMTTFSCYISGRLYKTDISTGIDHNSVFLQVQWKMADETVWNDFSFNEGQPEMLIANNNTKKLNQPIVISSSSTDETAIMQVRIRKMTLDSNNNDSGRICDLYLEKIRFLKGYNIFDRIINAPMNLEAVAVTAYADGNSQTNKFSALVESKCWVYDFNTETWSWDYNRNPAFWFLFFAYGGFKNLEANPSFEYPYSPTWGWVNYPGHPDSDEHIFGAGLTQDDIDMDKILEWAAFCIDKDLKMDMVLKDDTSCEDVLERIANIGRGSVSYYRGKLSVVYEDQDQSPVAMYGMGNIITGSFSVDYNVGDPVGKVVGKYVNRETWETEEVESLVPYISDSVKFIEVSLEGVTEKQQAQREVNILAARQYFQRRTYTWKVDHEGLLATRGDLVYISHDSTQYGYSGRIKSFIWDSGSVVGIETTSILEESTHVTIRMPDNTMATYSCHIDGKKILFDEAYPIEKASFFIDGVTDNTSSDYPNTIPEDFIFISGAKETPGKIVRISQIKALEDGFEISAVDEDPAMWAYEYDSVIPPESFDDVELVLRVEDVSVTPLGDGLVKLNWNNAEFIKVINEFTGIPLESNGSYSFTGGEVILELESGGKYTLSIEPFAIGTPYKSIGKKVVVWA